MKRIILAAAAVSISFAANAQGIEAKLICTAHTSSPEKQPAFQQILNLTNNRGVLSGVRELKSQAGKEDFTGIIGPFSQEVFLIGVGTNENGAQWNYELRGKLNGKGATQLKGRQVSTNGAIGERQCVVTF